MCGLCGFTGSVQHRDEVIRRMTDVITHYSEQIAHWVSYLTRTIDADYIIEDDGNILEK